MICASPVDVETREEGLYGSVGTGWACIAMIMYWANVRLDVERIHG